MKALNRLGGALIAVGVLNLAPARAAEETTQPHADEFAEVEVVAKPVAGSVYMLEGRGGNIGICVGEDGVFMIDDQFEPLTEKIRAAVAGVSDQSIRFLLNTHWHFDHTGGNENFGGSGATIMAHENVRARLSVDQVVKAFGKEVPALSKSGLPVVTFDSEVTLHINDETISIRHVANAHTDGDSFVHFEEANVIHAGDILFNGFYPFIDKGSGGSIDGMIAAMDKILSLANEQTKIIPGHGPLANKADVEKARRLLVSVEAALQPLVEQGRGVDEVVAANPLAHLDEEFGGGFLNTEAFTRIAADLLMP